MPDTTVNNTPQIIPPRVPLVDARTGLISREWYRFFLSIYRVSDTTTVDVDALLIAPPSQNSPIYADLLNIIDQVKNTDQVSSFLSVLENAIQNLAVSPASSATQALAVLEDQVHALAVTPATPEIQTLGFGSFTRSAAATATAINTPQTVSFEAQDISQGIEWVSGTPTRIYVYAPGVYDFQFSAQATKSSASLGYMWVWPAINGTDVPNSSSRVSFQGSNSDLILAWNWFLSLKAGDYFELKWAVDSLGVTLVQDPTPAFGPAIPSVILTANRVSL